MKRKGCIIVSSLILAFASLSAQSGEQNIQDSDSLFNSIEDNFLPESLDADIDSLMSSWHTKYFTKRIESCYNDEYDFYIPDSVYIDRLNRLPHVIPMTYNDDVRKCIDLYTGRRRTLVQYMLGMADFYFPMIEQVLDKNGLPMELKYLTLVESALNPFALSRMGASGLWQFMLPTGRAYGLEINSLVDERRDPQKATEAACKYFKDMYEVYGDWNLVIASYNCGPGNVNKAIRRAGGNKDFWEIYKFLPRETRSYVPLFIAANYVMNYYCDHNICPLQAALPVVTDTIVVDKMLHLQQVSDVLGLNIEQLRALNPQYKRDIIPGHGKPYLLNLPVSEALTFSEKRDSIYNYNFNTFFANINPNNGGNADDKERITHVVGKKETLMSIANKYGVTSSQIKKWNNLSSSRVPTGKKLVIHVDNGGVLLAEKKQASSEKKQVSAVKEEKVVSKVASSEQGSDNFSYYKVKKGDSLYTISKQYPGVTASQIQKANGIAGSNIKPGQTLKIPIV